MSTAEITLSASLEDYLEAIYLIVQRKQAARAKDVGEHLNVGRSSVTGALQALAKRELINYAPYDVVTLTEKGHTVAQKIAQRHEVLKDFFVKILAVDADEADAAACKIEHAISEKILERFVDFADFVKRCPRCGDNLMRGFSDFCGNEKQIGDCNACLAYMSGGNEGTTMDANSQVKPNLTLNMLKPGTRGKIIRTSGNDSLRRRLMDMGATSGTLVSVERVAPFGDPIEVKIKGYSLTLRKEEAARIQVEPL